MSNIKKKNFVYLDKTSQILLFRALYFCIFVIFSLIFLLLYIYYLQIVCFKYYKSKSEFNSIKYIPIESIRGNIYDRNCLPLALNKAVSTLEIIPSKSKNIRYTIKKLNKIFKFTKNEINKFNKNILLNLYSVPIKVNLTDYQKALFFSNKIFFKEVIIKTHYIRFYPYKEIASHVIGYVANDNLKNNHIKNFDFITENTIGMLGVEKYYEKILHGINGYNKVKINSSGKIIKCLEYVPSIPGEDIFLNIDIKLHKYIKKTVLNKKSSVIVANAKNGEIIAMESTPSYDPNLLSHRLSVKKYNSTFDNDKCSLFNRSTQGVYPPASTIKPYILLSALNDKIINSETTLFDPGYWKIPFSNIKYNDWKKNGHGLVNLHKAIEESSDTFFYNLAYNMDIDMIYHYMMKFGFGQYTCIDLVEENIGVMPNKSWKFSRFKKPWYKGDTISIGIGQGYWTSTPIQMLKSLLILINDGIIKTPHIANIKNKKLTDEKRLYLNDKNYWKIIKYGMFGAANHINGTAYKSFYNSYYKIGAKSGTAQVYNLRNKKFINIKDNILMDHKLMIAFAPFDDPKIAIVVVLENIGTKVSIGNIVRKILDYIFYSNIF
ncbi:MAG: penicillin-binding protein 2 [Enterobacteriaceae bacterium]